jgi:hypothetical protein
MSPRSVTPPWASETPERSSRVITTRIRRIPQMPDVTPRHDYPPNLEVPTETQRFEDHAHRAGTADTAVGAVTLRIEGDKVILGCEPSTWRWPGKVEGAAAHYGKVYRLASLVIDIPFCIDRIRKGLYPEAHLDPPKLGPATQGMVTVDGTQFTQALTSVIVELLRNRGAKFDNCWKCGGRGVLIAGNPNPDWSYIMDFLLDWLQHELVGLVSPNLCRRCGGSGSVQRLPEEPGEFGA